MNTTTTRIYRVHIKAAAETVWAAITEPVWTVKYGYKAPLSYDLKPGGKFVALPSAQMAEWGSPPAEPIIVGEVLEVDPPHLLRQSYKMVWDQTAAAEPETIVTWTLKESDGVTTLTVIHEGENSPRHLALVAGEIENTGGGWSEILSDLKSLLETGSSMWPDQR